MVEDRSAIVRELSHNTHLSDKFLDRFPTETLSAYFNKSTDSATTFFIDWAAPVLLVAGFLAMGEARDAGLYHGMVRGLSDVLMAVGAGAWGTGIYRHVKEANLRNEITSDFAIIQNPSAPQLQ